MRKTSHQLKIERCWMCQKAQRMGVKRMLELRRADSSLCEECNAIQIDHMDREGYALRPNPNGPIVQFGRLKVR